MADITKALLIAHRAHAGDFRDDRKTPYIWHCLNVLQNVRNIFAVNDAVVEAATLIHDVEEDHAQDGYTLDKLTDLLGADVATMAHWVCKPARPPSADKLEFNREHYFLLGKNGPAGAKVIKMADRLDNLVDIAQFNPRRREFYIQDTTNLIAALDGTQDLEILQSRLAEIIATTH